ncbi:hypothetical protein HK102_014048 [Quaeritorhiza haematococci]|nr:hypothetical protein HK102_014048 [Quaeritorhiza haematococci]
MSSLQLIRRLAVTGARQQPTRFGVVSPQRFFSATTVSKESNTPATQNDTSSVPAKQPHVGVREIFEADLISGKYFRVPSEVSRRNVRIYRPADSVTQSGKNKVYWKIDFDVLDKWENPLMGWTSSGDTVQALTIKFKTKEDAILFAERQGYDYWVEEPKASKFTIKSYADNYKVRYAALSPAAESIGPQPVLSIA